jgi:hypothetical protein
MFFRKAAFHALEIQHFSLFGWIIKDYRKAFTTDCDQISIAYQPKSLKVIYERICAL